MIRRISLSTLLFLVVSLFVTTAYGSDGKITEVRPVSEENGYNIYLTASGKLPYTQVYSDAPPQIMLDFLDVESDASSDILIPEENPLVYRIFVLKFSRNTQVTTRIVIELRIPSEYTILKTSEGLVIRISVKQNTIQDPIISEKSDDSFEFSPTGSQFPVVGNLAPAEMEGSQFSSFIGIEDLLEIVVFDLPQFHTIARVSADGTISIPLVGNIKVRGLTKRGVEERLTAALESRFIQKAHVSVDIKENKSRQVSVLGAVRNPGLYYIISKKSLLQIISEAGGILTDAGRSCFVFRRGKSKVEIDLVKLLINGDANMNIEILPGDIVSVPRAATITVYVLGAVRIPGAVDLTTSQPATVLAAIARAGGPAENADNSRVEILRHASGNKKTIIRVDLEKVMTGKVSDIGVVSGDVINVRERFF